MLPLGFGLGGGLCVNAYGDRAARLPLALSWGLMFRLFRYPLSEASCPASTYTRG